MHIPKLMEGSRVSESLEDKLHSRLQHHGSRIMWDVLEVLCCDHCQRSDAFAENVRISDGRCYIISKGLKIHSIIQQIILPVLTQKEWDNHFRPSGQLIIISDNSPKLIWNVVTGDRT